MSQFLPDGMGKVFTAFVMFAVTLPPPSSCQLLANELPVVDEKSWSQAFRDCMHLTELEEEHMSSDKHFDHHFARQYPFLYARKYRFYFRLHIFQGLMWIYGRFGLHIIFLLAVSVGIVARFRSAQKCGHMEGAENHTFAFLEWPQICNNYILMTTGRCEHE